jgi:hypothetical protein
LPRKAYFISATLVAAALLASCATAGGSLPLYIEADLEAKGFTVRQIDIYDLTSARQRSATDPMDDFTFINTLVDSLKKPDKEALNKENMSGAMKVYDSSKFDPIFTCMFAGD